MELALVTRRLAPALCSLAAVVGMLAEGPRASAQTLWSTYFSGTQNGQHLGTCVANVFDVDHDGHSDYALGIPAYNNTANGTVGCGRVIVFSGYTGATLRVHTGAVTNGALGTSVAPLGDIDGDSYADYVAGAPGIGAGAGRVFCYSGQTGAVLWTRDGLAGDGFGFSLARVPSQAKFGISRLIVGAPQKTNGKGYVTKLDSNGNSIFTMTGWEQGSQFGYAVAYAGDYGNDNISDFAISAPFHDASNPPYYVDCGAVWIFDGSNGLNHAVSYGNGTNAHFGKSLGLVLDVNDDSHADLLVGTPDGGGSNGFQFAGYAKVLSGTNLAMLRTHTPALHESFGAAVCVAGDWNGDGKADYAIGSSGGGIYQTGAVTLFSGATGAVIKVLDSGADAWASGLPASVYPSGFGASLVKGNFGTSAQLGLFVGAPNSGYASGVFNQRGAALVVLK
ncbi:MAG: integrin alpha [Planctomycetes bacterium]|nr:integrin alpha [Planctomycetota bacterium]